jgi:hypothetical protein
MSIPKAVEEQERIAEEMMKNFQAGDLQPGAADTETPPVEEIPAEEPSPTEVQPSPDRTETLEYWRQRASTIEGKYNAETVRALNELSNYRGENAELKTQILELKSQMIAFQNTLPKQETPKSPDLEWMEEQSASFIPGVKSLIDMELEKRMLEIDKKIGTVAERAQKAEANTFFTDLSGKVSDWKVINDNKEFIDWLSQRDKYSARPKLDLLRDAVSRQDLETTASFFTDWKESLGKQAQDTGKPKPNIDKFASPSKPTGGAAKPKETDPVSRDFIKKFYEDSTKGKYRGREEEAKKIEESINLALSEGKIY